MTTSMSERVDPLVTGIHDRWDEQGLSGGPWPFMAVCAVARLNQILRRSLETALKELDLTRTGYFVLTTLALTSQGQARLSTLSRLLMIHATSVRLTVDQLEAAGLVRRVPHPRDRRATLVQITDTGRERASAVSAALESPDGPMAEFGPHLKEMFEALQPVRMAAGDQEL